MSVGEDKNSVVGNVGGTNGELLVPRKEPLVRPQREIVVSSAKANWIDRSVVRFQYYNSFNYSLLAENSSRVQLKIGITSANPQEGKTVTATNLAVSLTLGYQRKTVLVDLNFQYPRLHQIFNTAFAPGLLEALDGERIHLSATPVENLYVLAAGSPKNRRTKSHGKPAIPIGVEHTSSFGEVIRTLQQEFDFVIVDMPTVNTHEFPILFSNHLDGLLVVVELGRTRKQDIDKVFRHLNKNQVLGFVYNRVMDNG